MSKISLFLLSLPGLSILTFLTYAAAEGDAKPSPAVLIVPGIVILILVLINGFFVAAEFAIIGARPTQLERLAEMGHKTADSVLETLTSRQKQDQYIATAQLGITIASVGLAMYAEPEIAHFIEPYIAALPFEPAINLVETSGYLITISFLTYLHVVIGEMVPKTLALTDSVKMVLRLNTLMRGTQFVLGPLVLVLNWVGNLLLRLLRVPPAEGHARVLSPEELELLVSESAEGGLLNEEEEEMIRNIFDFGDRIVAQVMTPRTKVQAIPHDISYEDLLTVVVDSRHSRFPVYEGDHDHIIGIVHIKDLMRQAIKKTSSFDLRLVLRSVPAVPEDHPVETLLAAFKRTRLHMAIVLDEFGGMAGIVTLEDLVEEVVGEVRDEFDQEKDPYIEISPGVLEVSGRYLVDDLTEEVYLGDESLPDVETVGGLVIAKLGRPPVIGDEVIYNEYVTFKVLAVDRRAVARVGIVYPDPSKIQARETAVLQEDEEE